MTLKEQAHQITRESISSYLNDDMKESDEVFNRIYKSIYDSAMKGLLEEQEKSKKS